MKSWRGVCPLRWPPRMPGTAQARHFEVSVLVCTHCRYPDGGTQVQLSLGVLLAALPFFGSPPGFGIQSFPWSDLRPCLCQDSLVAPGCGFWLGGLAEFGVLTHGYDKRLLTWALWGGLVLSPPKEVVSRIQDYIFKTCQFLFRSILLWHLLIFLKQMA